MAEMWHLELAQLKQYIIVSIITFKVIWTPSLTARSCKQPLEFMILFLVLLSK